ncbi:hypothetical protein GCM10020295_67100 [Streptomyces cinereospinus]
MHDGNRFRPPVAVQVAGRLLLHDGPYGPAFEREGDALGGRRRGGGHGLAARRLGGGRRVGLQQRGQGEDTGDRCGGGDPVDGAGVRVCQFRNGGLLH